VRQLCEGLLAAHEAGIIHRDLKSANVLLIHARPGTPPRAVITDFGLARLTDEVPGGPVEPDPRRVGTPAYMAPEQLEGKPVTPATDLYALGIILFELLTGTRPFRGEGAWSTATQRLHVPAPSPRELRPELDRRWESLILRCLEPPPGQTRLRGRFPRRGWTAGGRGRDDRARACRSRGPPPAGADLPGPGTVQGGQHRTPGGR
jgi:serine/threonine protein kinase